MSGYTKGPWEAVEVKEGLWHILPTDRTLGRIPIAVLDHHRDGHEPTRTVITPADARIMASSPDLLNGINALLGLIQLVCSRSDIPAAIRAALESSYRVDEAYLAIAKAESL